jgi:hypothetical protein
MASSKTKTNAPVEDAPSGAMGRFRQCAEVLSSTGTAIPQALEAERRLRAELGRAEIDGGDADELRRRLDVTTREREAHARRRASAAEALLALGDELRQSRAAAAGELAAVAKAAADDFQMRWSKACGELGALHSEALALAQALRTSVPTRPPYFAALSADGTKMQVTYSGSLQVDNVELPREISGITGRLDQIDAALALCAAAAQAKEWDSRYVALARQRGGMPVTSGLFRVIRGFSFLGVEFPVGTLVNGDVMGSGLIDRYWKGRQLQPLESAAAAA